MEIAILALGCFWGPEEKFSKIDGIIKTEVGYCGGNTENTTYKDVCTGTTNHAEVVKLEYDEKTKSNMFAKKDPKGIRRFKYYFMDDFFYIISTWRG